MAGDHKSVAYAPSRVDHAVRLHVCAVAPSQVNDVARGSAAPDTDAVGDPFATNHQHGAGSMGEHLLERHATVLEPAEDAGHPRISAGAPHLPELLDGGPHPRVLGEAARQGSACEIVTFDRNFAEFILLGGAQSLDKAVQADARPVDGNVRLKAGFGFEPVVEIVARSTAALLKQVVGVVTNDIVRRKQGGSEWRRS